MAITFLGEICPSTDNLEQISVENHMKVPTSHEDNQTSEKSNGQVEDATSGDFPLENLCNSTLPDLPAPEKLLSVPGGLVDLPRGVLVEDTPGDSGRINDTDPRNSSKFISGRKRSYTESTLTEQSLNSFESSRMIHSRTTEFIPDDDDLLSSILGMLSFLFLFASICIVALLENKLCSLVFLFFNNQNFFFGGNAFFLQHFSWKKIFSPET